MTDWDSTSLKFDRAQSEPLSSPRGSSVSDGIPGEPEIHGKWQPRTTLVFILISCIVLWAGIFVAVFALI